MSNDTGNLRNLPRNGSNKKKLEPAVVNVRIKISALWAAMLFVFAYVDLFSLYRADFRASIEAGEIGGFTISQSFLMGTTLYVVIPSLMIFFSLVLRPRLNRFVNMALSLVYAVTITAGAAGEWSYYVAGSAVEVAILGAIAYLAWSWPTKSHVSALDREEAPIRLVEQSTV